MKAMEDPSLIKLLTVIYDELGFDLSQYKEGTLVRRIDSRMRRCEVPSYDKYIDVLRKDPQEIRELMNVLFINVTDFFRNPESFEAIDKVVISRVIYSKREKAVKTIKAWSCGCSYGDEPYSLAMLILEKLGHAKDKFNISVIGTDIDDEALGQAKDMTYPKEKLELLDKGLVKKYFSPAGGPGSGNFHLNDDVKKLVRFKHHDVIYGEPITHCDIILCRNMLIYFNKQLQEETLLKFYACLEPGGYLVLGMVESLVGAAVDHFENIDNKLRIYRKPDWLKPEEVDSKVLTQEDIDKIVKEMLG